MICEASFMGGPVDGQVRAFPGETPPPTVTFETWQATRWVDPTKPDEKARGRYTYVRRVSQLDSGPLWVFVPAEREDPRPWVQDDDL